MATFPNGYQYRRTITIDNTKVGGSANLTDFPMLFKGTYSYLALTTSSGKVENLDTTATITGANDAPADMIFTSDADGSVVLKHEVQYYVSTTGEIIVWIKIPTLDYNDDTVIYLFYGKSSVTTSQEDIANTWNSNYAVVLHCQDHVLDSSGNGNDGSGLGSGMAYITGKIGKGISFDGSTTSYMTIADAASLDTSSHKLTIQIWGNPSSSISGTEHFINADSVQAGRRGLIPNGSTGWAFQFRDDSDVAYSVAEGSALSHSAWHLIHGVYDQTDLIIYEDGSSVNSSTQSSKTVKDIGGTFWIGRHPTISTSAYIGDMDEFRYLINDLTSGWILTEKNNMDSPSTFYSIGAEEEYGTAYTKTLTDSVSLTSSLVKAITKVLSDTASLASSVTFQGVFYRVLSDSISLASSVLKAVTRTLSDVITTADVVIKQATKLLTDSISLSDTLSRVVAYARTLSDSISLTGSLTKLVTYGRTLTDSIGLTDTISIIIDKVNDLAQKIKSMFFDDDVPTLTDLDDKPSIEFNEDNPSMSSRPDKPDLLSSEIEDKPQLG